MQCCIYFPFIPIYMDQHIYRLASAALGGDTQKGLSVRSSKSNQTFKYLILPIWICSYTFNGRPFSFIINGQTGKIYGTKPLSWIKITLMILLFTGLLAGLYLLREGGFTS